MIIETVWTLDFWRPTCFLHYPEEIDEERDENCNSSARIVSIKKSEVTGPGHNFILHKGGLIAANASTMRASMQHFLETDRTPVSKANDKL